MPRARSLLAALCLAVARGFVDDVDGYDSGRPARDAGDAAAPRPPRGVCLR